MMSWVHSGQVCLALPELCLLGYTSLPVESLRKSVTVLLLCYDNSNNCWVL